jgi:predicted ATPase with chaperone activity
MTDPARRIGVSVAAMSRYRQNLIADLTFGEEIKTAHIAEAIQYRPRRMV